MNSYTSIQQKKIRELKGVVGDHVADRVLAEVLGKTKWDSSRAMDYWFEKGYADKNQPKGPAISEQSIQ